MSRDKILHDSRSISAALARGFSDRHFERGEGPGDEVELSCNEPSYCADLEGQRKIQLQELEITKMEVSPILVV